MTEQKKNETRKSKNKKPKQVEQVKKTAHCGQKFKICFLSYISRFSRSNFLLNALQSIFEEH